MDPITNKLAAYIIDSGKHAEFSSIYHSNDGFSITQDSGFDYVVDADALIFSAGINVSENQGIELMVSFSANNGRHNFSSSLIDPVDKRNLFSERAKYVSKTTAELFRKTYRGIFGFDCVAYPATNFARRENSSLYNDYSATRLRELLTEKTSDDSEINKALHAAGFMFVALRNVINGEPQPVFWANGHYTRNATDEDQTALEKIIVVCNSHLQTRYLNSLFSRARGFCPHLSV